MVDFPAIGSVCILWEFTLSSFYNPTFPPTPPISPTLTIQSPNPSSPSCPCAPHTIPRLSPQCHCPRLPLPPVQGPPARGKRTGTAEDTGHSVKQWKNEKRQNNGGLRRAFVTLAPGPLCRGWGGALWLPQALNQALGKSNLHLRTSV